MQTTAVEPPRRGPQEQHRLMALKSAFQSASHICVYLVLGLGFEIAGVVSLAQLFVRLAADAIDHTAALRCRACVDFLGPAHDVGIGLGVDEFFCLVLVEDDHSAIPRPARHVGDGVFVARYVLPVGKLPVQDVELALRFHREAVDRVLLLHISVRVEVSEAAAEIGCAAHLPEQPVHGFGALGVVSRQEGAELFREIEQDRAGLEHPSRWVGAVVHHSWNFRVRVGRHEAAAELVAVVDRNQPGVVFRAGVAARQQFLQHHRDFYAIRRAERVELQRVIADR